MVIAGLAAAVMGLGVSTQPHIRISATVTSVPMGHTVIVRARGTEPGGKPLTGARLTPYVNGRRWGAASLSDAAGLATFPLPLPNPGRVRIEIAVRPRDTAAPANWIWSVVTADHQTVWLSRSIALDAVPTSATLYVDCDDSFQAFLNGHPIARGTDFHHVQRALHIERLLHRGANLLTVEAANGTGPAGMLARLDLAGRSSVVTDSAWRVDTTRPDGWPVSAAGPGAARVVAPAGSGPWGHSIEGWPGLNSLDDFPVGKPIPAGVLLSNPLVVRVVRRPVSRPPIDPDHLVGMEWEPWFTPRNARWDTAEAVPIVGNYDSLNTDVIRQHGLWMAEAGIDFLLVDWSNNLWDKKHWSEHGPGIDELVRGTTALLDTYAKMRAEGVPVPRVCLLLGLDNGPQTTTTAIREEMDWVAKHYLRPVRYRGLWQECDGKPLMVIFNGGGPGIRASQPTLDPGEFSVRWMASQLQINHLDQQGYWSWMDGVMHPAVTNRNGTPEALTITPAFFGDGGWTYPQARGRRGGATYIEQWNYAFKVRPRFLLLNQWNEFAGQPEGGEYGPKKDQYVDSFNVELSDDIEPTSLTACAYRGCGGWGYRYLDLTRALVDQYHRRRPDTTFIALSSPAAAARASGSGLVVEWSTAGLEPVAVRVFLDGKVTARVRGHSYTLPAERLTRGRHSVRVEAEGPATRYLGTATERDPLHRPLIATAEVTFDWQGVDTHKDNLQ